MNSNTLRKIVISCFISVPLISSIISTVHLIDLFSLGNPSWMAKTVAVAIELGSIASFMALSVMGKINKFFVWAVFILLFFMQIIGNVYFSYNFLTIKLLSDANYINSFKEMTAFFIDDLTLIDIKMYISLLIGTIIPLISIFLLKSMTEYLGTDEEKEVKKEPILEETINKVLEEKIEESLEELNSVSEETKEQEAVKEEQIIMRDAQPLDTINPIGVVDSKFVHPAHIK